MPLIRKSGYGLCMDSASKRLLRLQSGWFKASFLSSALCSRTTATYMWNDASDDEYQFGEMMAACRSYIFYAGTSYWVSGPGLLGPAHFVANGCAPSLNALGGTWAKECTIGNVYNRMQIPSELSSFTITGARILFESPGETWSHYHTLSNGSFDYEHFYVPDTACNYDGIRVKLSSSLQTPNYVWTQTPDISVSADVLNDITASSVGVESYLPFSTGIAMPRFASGAWSAYNFSAAQVSWLNTNRTFYVYLGWESLVPSYDRIFGGEHYIYSRGIRGLRMEVYCAV